MVLKLNREMDSYRIDECLSVDDNIFKIEDVSAVDLVQEYGSPLYVVSENQIKRNLSRFKQAFSEAWPGGKVQIFPAVKASWNLSVQRILALEGCGADIYSQEEFQIALQSGVPPEKISVNGSPKSQALLEKAVKLGARITIDSLQDVEILERLLSETPRSLKTIPVRIRLRPPTNYVRVSDFVSEGPLPTDIASMGYKGGLSRSEAVEAGRRILKLPCLKLVGFHQHHGRHRADLDWWKEQMDSYAREMAQVCRDLGNFHPQEIDVGGGFAIPRDPHAKSIDRTAVIQYSLFYLFSRVLKLFGRNLRYKIFAPIIQRISASPNKKLAPTIENYAQVVTGTLAVELQRYGFDPRKITLQLEPGRSVHGNTGVHLARVCSVKKQKHPFVWNVAVIDTTEFFLTAGTLEHHLHDFRVVTRLNEPPSQIVDIVGKSCFADRILGSVKVPKLTVGDIIALLDTGAYQEGSASNFNALPRPSTVLVRNNESFLIRRPETFQDVISRDQIPEHLTKKQEVSFLLGSV
jgi:diaminopimelate decarboxylase